MQVLMIYMVNIANTSKLLCLLYAMPIMVVLVLHISIIKYIFEMYLGIILLQEVKMEKKVWKA